MTAEECLTRAEVKNERDLQRQIVGLLRLKGVEPIVSRMDRKTSNNLGTPDILFCVKSKPWDIPIAVGLECKFGSGKLSLEQEKMHETMMAMPNAWRVVVVRSVDEVLAILEELGLKNQT